MAVDVQTVAMMSMALTGIAGAVQLIRDRLRPEHREGGRAQTKTNFAAEPSLHVTSHLYPAEGAAAAGAEPTARLESLESNTRNHILAALENSGWIIDGPRGAAKILGLHPNTLRSRMKKLGIARAPNSSGSAGATDSAPPA